MALVVNMDGTSDVLANYHPQHANSDHISRPDLVKKLAVHALRKIPGAHHVIKRSFDFGHTKPVTQVHPPPYNNDGKMQMMHH